MLFQRFLNKRKKAAEATPQVVASQNQQALTEQALHGASPSARLEAIRQVVSPSVLLQILDQDGPPEMRTGVLERLEQLFFDKNPDKSQPSAPSKPLLDAFSRIEQADLIERVAKAGVSPDLRRAAIERCNSQTTLAICAVQDTLAANRACAAERLEDRAALEEVAREIGKRDKKVLRTTREKLRSIAAQEEQPKLIRAQCEEICAKTERLGKLGNWSQDRALLDHLERQWNRIEDGIEPEWQSRFESGRQRFLDAYDAYRHENAAQIAAREAQEAARTERETLLQELADIVTLTDEPQLTAHEARISAAWKTLPPLTAKSDADLDRRYRELCKVLESQRKTLADQQDANDRLRKLLAKTEHLLGESKPLEHKEVKSLIERGKRLADTAIETDKVQSFTAMAERLESRLAHQRKTAEQRLRQFPERLEELEQHLADGELKKADPLYQSLQAALDLIQSSGLQPASASSFSHQLRALTPRLREMQNWRRWGADQHREGLCADMEALSDKDLPLAAIAEQLHGLQMDWKGLDKTGSPANQGLWERFHQASEQVYARCKPFMESQAAERESNRIARERVCQQLEEFLSKVDWEKVEWKKILRAERETRQAWAAIGPTEPRQRKQLERRFHQLLKTLDQRLDKERRQNQALKRNLIEQVQALAEHPELNTAIERTKALQREWHTSVPARQKEENRLWQDFRAACDAVFERRAALHQAHANEMREHLAARESLCDEVMKVAASESDPQRLTAALHEFDKRWKALESLPVPRQMAQPSSQGWKHARAELENRRRAAEDQERKAALELLQRQAELCERLELDLLAEQSGNIDPQATLDAWRQLPRQANETLQQTMETRFAFAQAAITDPDQCNVLRGQRQINAEKLTQLCLQLEIIAGVDSPPELAQQRLEYQVSRLAERMVEGEEDPLEGAARLLQDWYLHGPATGDPKLSERFERIRRTLESTQSAAA